MNEIDQDSQYSAPSAETLRTPPYSMEAEQAVLGGLMLENNCWDLVADQINENDFHLFDHRIIFRAIAELAYNNQPFDVVTLADKIKQADETETANIKNVTAYVATLARETPTAANISAYAGIVREKSILRQLASTGTEIAGSAYQTQGLNSSELLDIAEKKIFQIGDQGARHANGFKGMKELLNTTVERINELSERGDTITGLPTGFDDFDNNTSGLQNGDLIIVAGRPSMGKTSFAMNMIEYAIIKRQASVAVFSMEMPSHQLTMRMLSSMGRVNAHNLRTGNLNEEEWRNISSTVSILSEAKLFIDDSAALSPTEIRARARRLKREHGLSLIIIDYLQLMQITGSTENRTNDVSEISRSLKALAKELDVPVIALSQLNRSLEQRTDKRPVMSDLRESGAIEQDADIITFIYRDEVYNEESPDKGTAEIIVAKQRNGPIFKTRLTFMGQYTRFENYAPDFIIPELPS